LLLIPKKPNQRKFIFEFKKVLTGCRPYNLSQASNGHASYDGLIFLNELFHKANVLFWFKQRKQMTPSFQVRNKFSFTF